MCYCLKLNLGSFCHLSRLGLDALLISAALSAHRQLIEQLANALHKPGLSECL